MAAEGQQRAAPVAAPTSATLMRAWSDWVEQHGFTHFATLTFTFPVDERRARKLRDCWINRLNRALYKNRWYRRDTDGLRWASVLERCRSGAWHLHLLIASPRRAMDSSFLSWSEWAWQSKCGRAEVGPIRSGTAAATYLCKTIGSGGEVEFSRTLK